VLKESKPIYYALFNSLSNSFLEHPAVGKWYTTSLREAEGMKEDCLEYLKFIKMEDLIDKIEIKEIDA
jgi:hypothetical protein